MLRFVVTDIDGTIVDSMPKYVSAFCALVEPFGISQERAREMYFGSAGTPIDLQFKQVLQSSGVDLADDAVKELVRLFFEKAREVRSPPFPGARDVLQEIKARGLLLCATSGSNTGELKEIFAQEGLEYYVVLGSDVIKKGDLHIQRFAEYFGVSLAEFCSQAIYLGDGPTDMEIARRNGILACGITTTVSREKLIAAGAEVVVQTLLGFRDVVRSFQYLRG